MSGFLRIIKENRRAAPLSFALMFILPCLFFVGFGLAAFYFKQSFFTFRPCAIRRLTGLYCPTCGVTGAVRALLNIRFFESLRRNPFPLLTVALLFIMWVKAVLNVLVGKTDAKSFGFFVCFYVVLGAGLLFCLLRNISAGFAAALI